MFLGRYRISDAVESQKSQGAIVIPMVQLVPRVMTNLSGLSIIDGVFFRAVDERCRDRALSGSRATGRFSPPSTPTLYLSSSRAGVAAAMIAHEADRAAPLAVLSFRVHATHIADLRDSDAMQLFGIDPALASEPWQELIEKGETPPSWTVRETLEDHGAFGLIDPSRKAPGLWHLTLFTWNKPGSPQVTVSPADPDDFFVD